MNELDYKIIKSGSSGNAVRIEDVMIDCGTSYSQIKEELYKCKLLFITHIHSDHLKLQTFNQIKQNHRSIKVIGNYQVAEKIRVDVILGDHPRTIKTKKYSLKPFLVPHSTVTHGFVMNFKSGIDLIYVTDSAGTKDWIEGKYDYLFIESNHDEGIINQISEKEYGYEAFQASKRHTSIQESKAFYYMNRKSPDSKWIELHKSERFYK